MNFEELQKAWQSQAAGATVTIQTDVLLREVRRNQRQFQATIFRRDLLEVGGCALMTIGFLAWGLRWHWWSLDLVALGCLVTGAFLAVDRQVQRRRQPVRNDSLQACIENSLFQVNHQIWLLKNIFFWYLLPPIIGIAAVAGQVVWERRNEGLTDMLAMGTVFVFTYGFTFGFVYWANQQAIRKELNPRRQELETLLAGLK